MTTRIRIFLELKPSFRHAEVGLWVEHTQCFRPRQETEASDSMSSIECRNTHLKA